MSEKRIVPLLVVGAIAGGLPATAQANPSHTHLSAHELSLNNKVSGDVRWLARHAVGLKNGQKQVTIIQGEHDQEAVIEVTENVQDPTQSNTGQYQVNLITDAKNGKPELDHPRLLQLTADSHQTTSPNVSSDVNLTVNYEFGVDHAWTMSLQGGADDIENHPATSLGAPSSGTGGSHEAYSRIVAVHPVGNQRPATMQLVNKIFAVSQEAFQEAQAEVPLTDLTPPTI